MTATDATDDTAGTTTQDRQRAVWALGDYPRVAHEVIPDLGRVLVEASGIRAGQRVLDVAAGAGNAAIPAARLGASVVASDLTPALLDAGRRAGEEAGVSLEWQEADAAALPYDDASFDAVISCVGVMFAADHQRCADEMLRVCRTGGTLGLASWTPEGFVGQMLRAVSPYAPPPPPGARPAPLWGQEAHVLSLLGDGVVDVATERRHVRVTAFATAAEFRRFFAAYYGPTVAVYRSLAEDPARTAELDAALDALAHDARVEPHPAPLVMDWEYLLLTARRRG